jgi:hypothetical protein
MALERFAPYHRLAVVHRPRATRTNGVTRRTTRTTARCWSDAEKWAWLSIIASEEGKEQEMPLLVLLD